MALPIPPTPPPIRNEYLYKICFPPLDVAGLGAVDSSATSEDYGCIKEGAPGALLPVNTLGNTKISAIATDMPQPMYGIFGWPMDRIHIFLDELTNIAAPTDKNTPLVSVMLVGGVGNNARKVCLTFDIKAQAIPYGGRLVQFAGRLYQKWELYAFVPFAQGAGKDVRLKLRILLDRIGNPSNLPWIDADGDLTSGAKIY